MPTRGRGFTLLELLLVMVLVGVLLSLVGLGLSAGPVQQARQEARLLTQRISQLRDDAVTEAREYGLRFTRTDYQVMSWNNREWQPVGAGYLLPAGLHVRLELDGQASTLGERLTEPQVLILSSDETSAFTLHFETRDGHWLSLSSDGLNAPVTHEN